MLVTNFGEKLMAKPDKVDVELDCRNLSCPMPVVKLKKTINGMQLGQIVEMVATDPGSVSDISGWSQQTGHELLHHEQVDKDYFYYIKKSK